MPPHPDALTGAFLPQPATAWREVWNARGTLYAASLAPDDPVNVLWAVGDGGRLMRTEDEGTTWKFSRLPGRPTLYALTLVSSRQAFAAGTDGALYRTEDGGDTWIQLVAPDTGTFYTLDAAGDTLWLGGEAGLFLSEDGGETWTRLLTKPVTAWARAGSDWLVGTSGGTLYHSTDNGTTWQSHPLTTGAIHALLITHDGTFYAAGANGFLLKTASPDDLVAAVRTVYRGESALDPTVAQKLLHYLSGHAHPATIEPLTPREKEVLQLAAQGLTNRAIGQRLGISDRTVQGHLANIYQKLQVSSRTEAVTKALQLGIIELPDEMS